MGDLGLRDEVLKLALVKCKLNIEEAIMMATNPDQIKDIEDEIAAEEAENQKQDLLAQFNDEPEEQLIVQREVPLSEMVSNQSFEMLFHLLNLGVPLITHSSWSLLSQVPVNQQLLQKIRLLKDPESGSGERVNESKSPMSQLEWSKIIDPNGVHKMLYSL